MKALFLGDVCPTEETARLFCAQDIAALFGDAVSVFEDRDFTFANLECALTEHDEEIKKFGPNLKAPRETAEVLKKIGVDCCGLSNNHVYDYGRQGIADTLQALAEAGIDSTGFGDNYEDSRKSYTVERDGEKICIIAVCEHEYSYALENRMGSRPYDEYDTIEDIRASRAVHDRVIVIYHGGKEFCRYPSPRLHKLCHAMARAGADLVLCQHSHCIGSYEFYHNCHILYGQGNFHFVRPKNSFAGWHTALAVEYDTRTGEIGFVPLKSLEHGICLAAGEEKEEILRSFEARNQTLLSGEWRQGWRNFCEENREAYTKVIRESCLEESTERQNGKFSHFLDCEAHTDVWRELFPSDNLTNP